ncbi:DNA-directed RNA polymerase I subunit rpa49 [Blyttiomyces sp. JEL0837]|nr:DNA-directed RNA polymerase I subunit rpa49 [Blyttiomyces sp. JEL0837]
MAKRRLTIQTEPTSFLASFSNPENLHEDSLDFTLYRPASTSGRSKRQCILVGDKGVIELQGRTIDKSDGARYLVGICRKGKNEISVKEMEHASFATVVKSLNGFVPSVIGRKSMIARNALGETFGTIKRKQAIKALERNKVKVSSLDGVEDVLKNTIDDSSAILPDQDTLDAEQDKFRPIPPFNRNAPSPSQVYRMEDIVSSSDASLIQHKPLLKFKYKEELKTALDGYQVTSWVFDRIFLSLQNKSDTTRLRQLIYMSYMIRFVKVTESQLNKEDALLKVFQDVPSPILDGFIQRFTEAQEDHGKLRHKMPARLKDKLLGYIFCLALLLDDYKVDVGHLANDLSLSVAKVQSLFKELGCKVDAPKKNDAGEGARIAVLTVPLTFPVRRR